MKKGIIIGLLASFLVLSFASIAFAQITDIKALVAPPEVKTLEGLTSIIDKAINIIFTVLLIGASIFIITAAFQFLTGGGDAEQLTQARGKIIWAVVAIVIAVLAKGIPTIVKNFLTP